MQNKIIENLNELPEKISNKELDILEMQQELDDLKEKNDMIETIHIIEVTNLKGEDNKPKFSNETSRQAEIRRKLALDKDYRENDDKLRDRKHLLEIKKIELGFLLNQQSNLRAITRIYGNE